MVYKAGRRGPGDSVTFCSNLWLRCSNTLSTGLSSLPLCSRSCLPCQWRTLKRAQAAPLTPSPPPPRYPAARQSLSRPSPSPVEVSQPSSRPRNMLTGIPYRHLDALRKIPQPFLFLILTQGSHAQPKSGATVTMAGDITFAKDDQYASFMDILPAGCSTYLRLGSIVHY